MTPRHVAGEGEAEADALAVLVAAFIEPVEGFEGLVILVFRDAGTIILDPDLDP